MRRALVRFTLFAACMLFSSGFAQASDLKIGDAGPDFSGIVGTDDKEHSLKDFESAKLVVLVFTCNHCAASQLYEGRLRKLDQDYRQKGVTLVAINSERADAMPLSTLRAMPQRF